MNELWHHATPHGCIQKRPTYRSSTSLCLRLCGGRGYSYQEGGHQVVPCRHPHQRSPLESGLTTVVSLGAGDRCAALCGQHGQDCDVCALCIFRNSCLFSGHRPHCASSASMPLKLLSACLAAIELGWLLGYRVRALACHHRRPAILQSAALSWTRRTSHDQQT